MLTNSDVSGYVNEPGDRYMRRNTVTSFDIFDDVTKNSDVSRCDLSDEEVVAARYGCSPATRQVLMTGRRISFLCGLMVEKERRRPVPREERRCQYLGG